MATLFWVLAPVATTNLIANPSVETNETGYTAVGGAIAATTAQYRRGAKSEGVTPTAGTGDGVYYLTASLATATAHVWSFDFLGVLGVPYTAYFATTAGAVKGTPLTFIGTGAWARYHVHWTTDAAAAFRLYVIKNNDDDTGVFYLDGLQLEARAEETTYVDGAQALSAAELQAGFTDDGVAWTGTAHASTSTRASSSRRGGTWLDLGGLYFFVESMAGHGAAPVEQARSQYANSKVAGSLFESSHERERVITLNGILMGTSLSTLDVRLNNLAYYLRPNVGGLAGTDEPFLLRWTGGSTTKEIACHYEGGLEGGPLEGFNMRCAIKLVADYPYWSTSVL